MMSANPEEHAQQMKRPELTFSKVDIAFAFISIATVVVDVGTGEK
jgi:hypothetical protein